MSKLISFIVPAFNEEKHLVRCIQSIIEQNESEIEIVLIDDGSTDNTFGIMERYNEKYDFIQVFREEKSYGPSHARNIGINNATGEYLFFLDADDYLIDDTLGFLCREIKNNRVDCIFFSFKRERDGVITRNPAEYELMDFDEERVYTGKELFEEKMKRSPRIPDKLASVVELDFIKQYEIRFFEGAVYEDGMFNLEIYLHATRVRQLTKAVFVYYNNSNSIGHMGVSPEYGVACAFLKYEYFLSKRFEFQNEEKYIKAYTKNLYEIYCHFLELKSKLKSSENPLPILKNLDIDAAEIYMSLFGEESDNEFSKYEKSIINAEKVIVYGAQSKAKRIARYLDGLGKEILSYIVSDEVSAEKDNINPRYIYGIPVIPLSHSDDLPKDALVVITLRKVHWESISKRLNNHGFYNLLYIA